MSLDPERWRRVRAVFDELAELPPAEQAQRLGELTFGDPMVRDEVLALLEAARAVGDRFEQPAAPNELRMADVVGRRVGPYEIIREIGRGGMGAVYEACRVDAEFTKRVAIKMVSPGLDTSAVLRRFRYERQILARLEHRNIAALLDGGVTAEGQPFFAMEYVEGERIDRYCERHRLAVPARLQLFRQVCTAVQYAHQNLVVHRDLKPSNILVTADGTVKLLDFGIAKLLESTTDPADPLTQTGVLPMTTAYASPEQLRGETVTTASDVYSLGVVLYELLAGRTPFAVGDLPVLEARRRMLDQTPVAPSTAVTEATAAASGAGPASRLQRTLAGELDNIVLMALRKEPERRYSSAEQLSEDLLRFLAGLPVQAQPDSMGYRTRKFLRRHRSAVAALGLAGLALAGGTVVSVWQARVARLERDRARAAQAVSEQMTDFFKSILASAKPGDMGSKVTVLEAIEAAVPRIDSAFAGNPQVREALISTMGSTLFELGAYDEADPLLRKAHQLQQVLDSGRVTWEGATTVYDLAGLAYARGQLPQAESLFRKAMTMYESVPHADPVEIARGYNDLAQVIGDGGRLAESVELTGKVVDVLARHLKRTDRALIVARSNYATGLAQLGRYAEAEPLMREALAAVIESKGPNAPDVAAILQPLAQTLSYRKQFAEAESLARRSYAIRQEAFGPTSPLALVSMRTVLSILTDAGRCSEAMPMARDLIAQRGRVLTEADITLSHAFLLLGECLAATGSLPEAEAAVRQALALRSAALPPTHWAIASTKSVLGQVLARRGRRPEAERFLVEGLDDLRRELGSDHREVQEAAARLEQFRAAPLASAKGGT